MSKILSIVVSLAIIAHLIRPLGFPGLKRRKDAWKIVVVAFALIAGTILIRPEPADDLPPAERPAVALPTSPSRA